MKNEFVENLYHMYSEEMCRCAQSILHDDDLAEDAVSQAFFVILGKAEQISLWDDKKIKCYIFLILKNTCFSMLRKLEKQKIDEPQIVQIGDMQFQSVENTKFDDLKVGDFMNYIVELPQNYRKVICLRYICEYSYKEIAKIVGVSESCVGVILSRARKKLKEIIKQKDC